MSNSWLAEFPFHGSRSALDLVWITLITAAKRKAGESIVLCSDDLASLVTLRRHLGTGKLARPNRLRNSPEYLGLD